jgi:hypothetical protein
MSGHNPDQASLLGFSILTKHRPAKETELSGRELDYQKSATSTFGLYYVILPLTHLRLIRPASSEPIRAKPSMDVAQKTAALIPRDLGTPQPKTPLFSSG